MTHEATLEVRAAAAHDAPAPRAPSSGAPAALRAIIRTIGRALPGPTAAWAARKFLTPRAAPPRPAERAVLATARKSEVLVGRKRVVTYAWGNEGAPVALLVHGWNGHAGHMTPFVEPLVAKGLRVVAFDAPGHGGSDPGLTHVVEIGAAVATVAAGEGGVRTVIAHSAGAMASAVAARDGMRTERMVLIAGAVRSLRWVEDFARHIGFPDGCHDELVGAVERLSGERIADLSLDAIGHSLRCRVDFFHDADDPIAPLAEARAASTRIPGSRLVETRDLGHYRILRDPAITSAVVELA